MLKGSLIALVVQSVVFSEVGMLFCCNMCNVYAESLAPDGCALESNWRLKEDSPTEILFKIRLDINWRVELRGG